MYEIRRKDYHKQQIWEGIIPSILSFVWIYLVIPDSCYKWDLTILFMLSLGFIFPLYTLFHLIKYIDKKNNYVVCKIDDYGIFLCPKVNEGVFIPWEKIKCVTFVYGNYGRTEIAILQYNKKSHNMLLTDFNLYLRFHLHPRNATKAAYKYADNATKIKEIKECIQL